MKRKKSSLERKEEKYFFLFISPWIIGFLAFTVYPMISSILYSFTDWDFFTEANFVGMENYKSLLQDDMFWKALYNTFSMRLFLSR